jgi:hypothetical protein
MQTASAKSLYAYWNALRGARSAPDRRDIDPAQIRSALSNTFILERDESDEFSFRLAGSHLCAAYGRELKGRSFSRLWQRRDRDAMDTLIRAVTEDNAVALVTFQATTSMHQQASFETILLPVRHNGSTHIRILGAMAGLSEPYWLGAQPLMDQRITGLRLIWPDEVSEENGPLDVVARVAGHIGLDEEPTPPPLATTVFGRSARRYHHLAVIDGGRG